MAKPQPKLRSTSRRDKRLLALLAAIALAPVLLAYFAYHFWPREARVNYGTLLPAQSLAPIHGTRLDATPFDASSLAGRWLLVYAAPGECSADCAAALYASRQARTIQNAQRERVVRVWLVTDASAPSAALAADHPDLVIVRVDPRTIRTLPRGGDAIYVVDPLRNFVLAWPSKPDIKAMAKDLGRLLRASSIG